MTSDTDDLEPLRRELAEREQREMQRAELKERWLRGIGYVTRTLVYLIVAGLLYLWLVPTTSISGRSLGSLTLEEIAAPIFCLGVGYFWLRLFFNHAEDHIEWESWGRFGLWIFAAIAVASFWLANQ